MKELFGGLIQIENHSKLVEFAVSADKEFSIKVIESAIEYGMKNGLYSLDEAYCLFNCINKLKEK